MFVIFKKRPGHENESLSSFFGRRRDAPPVAVRRGGFGAIPEPADSPAGAQSPRRCHRYDCPRGRPPARRGAPPAGGRRESTRLQPPPPHPTRPQSRPPPLHAAPPG